MSLSVTGASGRKLLYKGFIEADVSVPSLGNDSFFIPVKCVYLGIQAPLMLSLQSGRRQMCDDTIPVRTTNNYNLRIWPGEIKTLQCIVRNTKDMHTDVTEHTDSSLSGDLPI